MALITVMECTAESVFRKLFVIHPQIRLPSITDWLVILYTSFLRKRFKQNYELINMFQFYKIDYRPSTSKNENLPRDLAEAERRGKSGNCAIYEKLCPTSILDAISMFI